MGACTWIESEISTQRDAKLLAGLVGVCDGVNVTDAHFSRAG